MKLLIITHALEKGGAEKLIVDSIAIFRKEGIQVEILLLSAKKSVPDYLDIVKDQGVIVHDLNVKSLYSIESVWKLRRFFKVNSFSIAHVHLFPSLYWAAIAIVGLSCQPKLIYTEHSTTNKRRGKAVFMLVEKLLYSQYTKIIAITDKVRDNLVNWVGLDDKIITIENGVDLQAIELATSIDRSVLCQELNLPNEAIIGLMVASFRYPKDHETVLKALSTLNEDFYILFAGEGEQKEKVLELAKELRVFDRIRFLGFRTDVKSLMKSVDYNILSSTYEGMSGVTLESLASGTVFLGSKVVGIMEIVPNDNFLFEAGNSEDLARSIKDIVRSKEKRDSMSEEGKYFVKRFKMDNMVHNYISLYRKLTKS